MACDKVYVARIDVGPVPGVDLAASPLTKEDHDRAVALFASVAQDLGLTCKPVEYTIITDSYDDSRYHFQSCAVREHYTRVQLADSREHVAVEIHEIGGISEPSWFSECRSKFTTAYEGAFPKGLLNVRYPYNWGSQRPVASP